MPINSKGKTFDVTCDECGNVGMKKTQAPSANGVRYVFKCPECGGTKTEDDVDFGYFVSKT